MESNKLLEHEWGVVNEVWGLDCGFVLLPLATAHLFGLIWFDLLPRFHFVFVSRQLLSFLDRVFFSFYHFDFVLFGSYLLSSLFSLVYVALILVFSKLFSLILFFFTNQKTLQAILKKISTIFRFSLKTKEIFLKKHQNLLKNYKHFLKVLKNQQKWVKKWKTCFEIKRQTRRLQHKKIK